MNTKYLLQLGECTELLGPYDLIEAAKIDAEALAKEHGEPMDVIIWDARPATDADRELFEGMEDVDVTKPNWWTGLLVPENDVLRFKTALQVVPHQPSSS